MVARLIQWSVNNPLIVGLMTIALACAGAYAFSRVNVEAYPDPAPAIVEVIAQYQGRRPKRWSGSSRSRLRSPSRACRG